MKPRYWVLYNHEARRVHERGEAPIALSPEQQLQQQLRLRFPCKHWFQESTIPCVRAPGIM